MVWGGNAGVSRPPLWKLNSCARLPIGLFPKLLTHIVINRYVWCFSRFVVDVLFLAGYSEIFFRLVGNLVQTAYLLFFCV